MKYVLMTFGGIALLFGLFAFFAGKSAIHEIEGMLGGLIFAVCAGSASILEELQRGRPRLDG